VRDWDPAGTLNRGDEPGISSGSGDTERGGRTSRDISSRRSPRDSIPLGGFGEPEFRLGLVLASFSGVFAHNGALSSLKALFAVK